MATPKDIIDFNRAELGNLITECSNKEQLMFKRMYSHTDLDKDIQKVIEDLPDDKVNWALEQVTRTLDK